MTGSSFIRSIGTATPPHISSQEDVLSFMARSLSLTEEMQRKLRVLYRASGIRQRYSVLGDYTEAPEGYGFYPKAENLEPFPTVQSRMKIYEQEALKLSVEAVEQCFAPLASHEHSGITHVITVSCTGMYAPGLDIQLVQALNLPSSVQRTAINFMGCYGAFPALKTADAICRAHPEARVLIVCVELCSIHFQKKLDEDTLLANALFGDGAAAVLMQGKAPEGPSLSPQTFYTDLALEGEQDMAWHIGDFGFEMKLSAYVPDVIKGGIKELTGRLMALLNKTPDDIDYYAIHPGGKKILEAIEHELGLSRDKNSSAYAVLKEYGNMSSPTVLFVLNHLWQGLNGVDSGKQILSFAFGPGLTLESAVFEVNS